MAVTPLCHRTLRGQAQAALLHKSRMQLTMVRCFAGALALMAASQAPAEHALVAVATNFAEAAEQLQVAYENSSENRITLTFGSTGQLYARIVNGAPYDVLLAADSERPIRLEQSGAVVTGTRRVYAVGRLTLWSPDPALVVGDGREILDSGAFESLAIANPKLAPYGAAAKQALQSLNLWNSLEHRIVMGENAGQAHALVATGNARLGLISLSSVVSPRNPSPGSHWDVPASLHEPIQQELVLLLRGADNIAATGFHDFIQTERARAIITSFGYEVE